MPHVIQEISEGLLISPNVRNVRNVCIAQDPGVPWGWWVTGRVVAGFQFAVSPGGGWVYCKRGGLLGTAVAQVGRELSA